MKVIDIKPVGVHGDYIISVESGFFRKKITEYRGSCTVFHRVPDGTRVGGLMEGWLSDRLTAWKWAQHLY